MSEKYISRRNFFAESAAALGLGLGGSSLLGSGCVPKPPVPVWDRPPNFVILFADDMGYGDWDRGGHPTVRTPSLNRMADQGVRLTQFYSGNPVCSPSRAALLTGRNCIRTGVIHVFFPPDTRGLPAGEVTIAEALRPLGYSSACIGKWHLGCTHEFRPLRQGFDYYYGIPYSNDMENADLWRNDEVVEHPADQSTLTRRYTEEAEAFIEREKDRPFFLYLPYTFPHVPLFASDKFLGTSKRGLFGDVIEEIDWSVGRILDTLDSLGLSENTLVMFTSDNGPWMTMKQRGGTAGMLRGAKGDTWEGGMREPFIARWPGRLPAGMVGGAVGSVLDFLPTCVALAGGQVPEGRPLDGIDLMPALQGKAGPDRTIYFYERQHLNAVRHGKWKLHLRYYDHSRGGYQKEENWAVPEVPLLFDLEEDPGERFDLAAGEPQVLARLVSLAEDYRSEIERLGENRELLDWFINDWPTAPRRSAPA
ncbi:MAG: sulfatase [Candidatus Glassbacteria bacterium]|nr:sulfatase [Candidatus Glassbacteria bacterium]